MRWLILFLTIPAHAIEYQSKVIQSHAGGLVTNYSSQRLKEDQTSVLTNAYLDKDIAVVKRKGYSLVGTVDSKYSIREGWPYLATSGVEYYFVLASSQMYITPGDSVYTAVGGTVSATEQMYSVQTLGKRWFTNGVDPVWWSNASATSTISSPLGKLIGTFGSRLVLANSPGYKSTIYLSGQNDGTDFTLPAIAVDTSPVQFYLNGPNDGREVTCIYDGFKNVLILFNEDQMYGLYGNGVNSFVLRLLNNQVGCIEQKTVQEHTGKLRWLSKRGIEEFNGSQVTRVSYPVQDQVDNIIKTKQKTINVSQSLQSDWLAGNLTVSGQGASMSATISPGDVTPTTWTTISNNFSSYTLVNISSTASSGALVLSIATTPFVIDNFSDGNYTSNPTWTVTNGSFGVDGHGLYGQTNAVNTITTPSTQSTGTWAFTFHCLDSNGAVASRCPNGYLYYGDYLAFDYRFITIDSNNFYAIRGIVTYPSGVFELIELIKFIGGTKTILGYKGIGHTNKARTIQIDRDVNHEFKVSVDSVNVITVTDSEYVTSNLVTISGPALIPAVGVSLFTYISSITNTYSYYNATGTLVSPVFNTYLTTPTWGLFSSSLSSNTANTNITFNVQSATSSNGVWGPYTLQSMDSRIDANQKQYVRFSSSFSTNLTTVTPTFYSATLNASTTGQFITKCFLIDSSVSNWGLFQANYISDGGSLSFYVSTGPTCESVTIQTMTWTSQTNNSNITVSTAHYVGVKVAFSLSTGVVQQPKLQDITINYQTNLGRPTAASVVYSDRYWLAYTTSTSLSAYNDNILVYDSYGKFSQLKGINASSLWMYVRQLYSGSAIADGKIYLQDTGDTDNGSSILFTLRTPYYDLDFPGYKLFRLIKSEVAGSSSNLDINYYVDNGTTSYSLGSIDLSQDSNWILSKHYFPQDSSPSTARNLAIEYTNTSAYPMKIYRTKIDYYPLIWR